jgi:6-phosphofructokinase
LLWRHIGAGFIAMYATLASRDVDCCLIPESPFYLDGPGGLLEFIERRLREQGHMVIVIAEGAGQELIPRNDTSNKNKPDASADDLFQDVGLWLSKKIKVKNFKVFPYYYGQCVVSFSCMIIQKIHLNVNSRFSCCRIFFKFFTFKCLFLV